MHVVQTFNVEWEDKNEDEHIIVGIRARTASEAWEKAEAQLKKNPDFLRVLDADLYP
jgi:hypothetical protein